MARWRSPGWRGAAAALGLAAAAAGCAGSVSAPEPRSNVGELRALASQAAELEASGHLREAAHLQRRLLDAVGEGEPVLRARVAARLGAAEHGLGEAEAALATLEEGRRGLEAAAPEGEDGAAERADAWAELADVYGDLGRADDAETLHRRALALRVARFGDQSGPAAASLHALARLARAGGHLDAAEDLFARALAIRERERGPDHPDTAAVLNNLGLLHRERGDLARAEPALRRAAGIFADALGPSHARTGMAQHNLAELLLVADRHGEAAAVAERAVAAKEAAFGPRHPRTADSLAVWGLAAAGAGDDARAVWALERALGVWAEAAPSSEVRHVEVLAQLAGVHRRRGERERADALLADALERFERLRGPDDPRVQRLREQRDALHGEGDAARRGAADTPAPRDLSEARAALARGELRRAREHFALAAERAGESSPLELALALAGLAECETRLGREAQAETAYLEAIERFERAPDATPAEAGATAGALAALLVRDGRREEAAPWFERALRELAPERERHRALRAELLFRAAENLAALERREEAIERLEACLALRDRPDAQSDPALAETLEGLGALIADADPGRARGLLERAVALREAGGADPVALGMALSYLGRSHAALGDPRAEATLRRALDLLAPALGALDPFTLETRARYERVRGGVPASRAPGSSAGDAEDR